ncbi:MAG: hypothetical protein LBC52_04330 [Treponema sp.]|jgi:hypothetical protein|nr:hypothetical protein [Treponema sp.]
MADKIIPTKVRIDGKWYNAREGWAGKLELLDSGKVVPTVEFTANEPYTHISNYYFVSDSDGNKVGEIDIKNNKCTGRVNSFEIPSNFSVENIETSNSNSSNSSRNEETYSNSNSYEAPKMSSNDPFAEAKSNAENVVGQLYSYSTARERVGDIGKLVSSLTAGEYRRAEEERERIKKQEAEWAEKSRQRQLWKEQGLCPDCGRERFLFFKQCKTCIIKDILVWKDEILLTLSFALLFGGISLGILLENSFFSVIGFIFGGIIRAFREKENRYFRIACLYLSPICISIFGGGVKSDTENGWFLFFGIVFFVIWFAIKIIRDWN